MKLVLLVSLKLNVDANWGLAAEIEGAAQSGEILPLRRGYAVRAGRDAFLFEQTNAHDNFVQACARLIMKKWPYFCVPVEADAILAAGNCEERLLAILGRSPAPDA